MDESPTKVKEESKFDVFALDKEDVAPSGPVTWVRGHKWWLIAAAVAVAVIAYFSLGNETAQEARPLTVAIQYGDIENTVTAAGTLQPSNSVEVGAQVSGQLEKLHVEVGDKVKAGDLLAEIDATVQMNKVEASRASLNALYAQLASRESALELAKARLERQTRMMEEQATSQNDYDSAVDTVISAESGLTQLRSQIEQSKASLASDEATLGYSKIYAPVDGTVVSIEMKEGQTLNAVQMAPTILTIADLSTMTVEADVSEADVGKLTDGMEVYFTTLGGGDRRWESKLRQILPTPVNENNVILYTALFDVDNTDQTLRTNMTAQVFFLTDSAYNVLKVPVGALTYVNAASGGSANIQQGGPPGAPGSSPNPGMQGGPPGAGGQGGFPQGGPAGAGAQGGFPQGGPSGASAGGMRPGGMRQAQPQRQAAAGGQAQGSSRSATVRVYHDDGTIEERLITVGVTSRISAEVLSGLSEGEEVVAGIVDTSSNEQDNGPRGGMRFGPF